MNERVTSCCGDAGSVSHGSGHFSVEVFPLVADELIVDVLVLPVLLRHVQPVVEAIEALLVRREHRVRARKVVVLAIRVHVRRVLRLRSNLVVRRGQVARTAWDRLAIVVLPVEQTLLMGLEASVRPGTTFTFDVVVRELTVRVIAIMVRVHASLPIVATWLALVGLTMGTEVRVAGRVVRHHTTWLAWGLVMRRVELGHVARTSVMVILRVVRTSHVAVSGLRRWRNRLAGGFRVFVLMLLLIAPLYSIWSINLVDLDVLISEALSARLSIDLQMVRVLHVLRGRVVVLTARVESTELLLGLLLVENVEVGAVGRLDGDHEALIVRASILGRFRAIVVPNRQVLQVLISHVRVISVLRVGEDLLLLLFKICDQIVKLLFHARQLALVVDNL